MNKATRAKIALNELDSKLLNPRRNKEGISSIRRCISTWQQPYSSSHINCNKKQISLWLELVTVNSNHSMSEKSIRFESGAFSNVGTVPTLVGQHH